MHNLEKIIDSESVQVDKNSLLNYRSTPLKKKDNIKIEQQSPAPSSKNSPERWSEVQKKVAKRRKELEERN